MVLSYWQSAQPDCYRLEGRVYRKEVGLTGSVIPLHNCIKEYFSLGLGKISQIGPALGK